MIPFEYAMTTYIFCGISGIILIIGLLGLLFTDDVTGGFALTMIMGMLMTIVLIYPISSAIIYNDKISVCEIDKYNKLIDMNGNLYSLSNYTWIISLHNGDKYRCNNCKL
jgi:hypothetical protein